MKIKNIFKKSEKKTVNPTTERLDKKQLEKVIGGLEVAKPKSYKEITGTKSGDATT